jgi:hypothetical protein
MLNFQTASSARILSCPGLRGRRSGIRIIRQIRVIRVNLPELPWRDPPRIESSTASSTAPASGRKRRPRPVLQSTTTIVSPQPRPRIPPSIARPRKGGGHPRENPRPRTAAAPEYYIHSKTPSPPGPFRIPRLALLSAYPPVPPPNLPLLPSFRGQKPASTPSRSPPDPSGPSLSSASTPSSIKHPAVPP